MHTMPDRVAGQVWHPTRPPDSLSSLMGAHSWTVASLRPWFPLPARIDTFVTFGHGIAYLGELALRPRYPLQLADCLSA